jgi:hypothetical protein
MADYSLIHAAIKALYPQADPAIDYVWSTGDDGVPVMAYWNTERLGELLMVEIDAKTDELAANPRIETATREQFYQTLADREFIDQADVEPAIQGTIPVPLQQLIDQLPAGEQEPAETALINNSTFHIDEDVIRHLMVVYGLTDAQLEELFRYANTL